MRNIFFDRVMGAKKRYANGLGNKKGAGAPSCLLQFVDHLRERIRVIHGQVGEHLAVQVDPGFFQFSHELGIRHSVETCTGVDTLDPQGTEVALLGFAIAVGIDETFFDRVLGDGPNIFLSSKESFGKFEHPFAPGAGCYVVH